MNTKQLRQKILDLAIKGKLVPQDPNDEPASKLLERIRKEKEQLIKDGKIKRDKNESYIFVGDDKLHYEKFLDGNVICIEDEIPFEIPESWEWERLQNICTLLTDGTHQTPTYTDMGHIFLSSKNVTTNKINWDDVMYIPNELHDKLYNRLSPELNDILLAKNGTIGKAALVDRDIEFDVYVTLAVIRLFKDHISSQYIHKIIESKYIQDFFKGEQKGIGVPNLHLENIRRTLIPLPPQSEQQRISKSVETLIELVDTIDSDKIELSDLIKQTKAKVLDLAIKGKLVPQDPNDEPADKLLEKIREEKEKLIKEGKLKRDKNETFIFKNSDDNSYYEQIDGETVCIDDDLPFEIPDSWRWCKIDNIAAIKGGKRLPSGYALLDYKTNHPYLRIVDMKNNTIIDDDIHYISEDVFAKIKQYIITDEDLYITIAGTIGNVGIIPFKYNNANLTENAVRVTPLLINKKYLMYLTLSNYVQNQFIDKTHHVAMPKLAIERIKGVLVPMPSLKEQNSIIEKLENIFSYLDSLETITKGS